jgi:hypothetical protein
MNKLKDSVEDINKLLYEAKFILNPSLKKDNVKNALNLVFQKKLSK